MVKGKSFGPTNGLATVLSIIIAIAGMLLLALLLSKPASAHETSSQWQAVSPTSVVKYVKVSGNGRVYRCIVLGNKERLNAYHDISPVAISCKW